MRILIALLFFVFSIGFLSAQNLIQNGDLEDTIPQLFGLKFANHWESANNGSPDYLSEYHNEIVSGRFGVPENFVGYQIPRSKKSMLGILVLSISGGEFREYVQNTLSSILMKDSIYCFQMYASLADSFKLGTRNGISIYFSQNRIRSDTIGKLDFVPQINLDSNYLSNKVGWIKLNGQFKANGGEQYLIVGNFNNDLNTDTVELGGSSDPIFNGTYYYLDDFYLGHCDSLPEDTSIGLLENVLEKQINVYPNPTKNELFIHYQGKEKLQVRLFDVMGKELSFAYISTSLNVINEIVLTVAHLPKGLYFLEIVAGENRISKKILKD